MRRMALVAMMAAFSTSAWAATAPVDAGSAKVAPAAPEQTIADPPGTATLPHSPDGRPPHGRRRARAGGRRAVGEAWGGTDAVQTADERYWTRRETGSESPWAVAPFGAVARCQSFAMNR